MKMTGDVQAVFCAFSPVFERRISYPAAVEKLVLADSCSARLGDSYPIISGSRKLFS